MIKGFVSRRTTQRVPYEAEIGIQFACGDNTAIIANTTNLSPEGVRFFVPKGQIKLAPEEVIELAFKLPNKEEFTVQGEICYFSNAMDNNEKPVVYYGVRFINLTSQTSDAIREFCQIQLTGEPASDLETQPDTGTSTDAVNEYDPEMMDPAEFEIPEEIQAVSQGIPVAAPPQQPQPQPISAPAEIPSTPQPAMPNNPLTAKNENDYRSLSQDLIDQIIRSMTSTQSSTPTSAAPAPNVTSSESASNRQAAAATENSVSSIGQNEPVFQMENQHDLLAQIRKIAESINTKIDDELFEKNTSPVNKPEEVTSPINPAPATSAEPEPAASALNQSNPSKGPNGLDFAQSPAASESNLFNKSIFSLPSSNLLDELFGTEPGTESQPAAPVKSEATKIVNPPHPTQPKVSTEPETGESNQQVPSGFPPAEGTPGSTGGQININPMPKKASSIQMDQRMIDQLVQSSTSGQVNISTIPKKASGVPMDQRMIDQIVQSMLNKEK